MDSTLIQVNEMTKFRLIKVFIATGIALLLSPAFTETVAGGEADADVIEVRAIDGGANGWTFQVTVAHPDTGWDDYCDGWDIVTEHGEVLKTSRSDPFTRLLFHPHQHEQPFTRSQNGIDIPVGTTSITVRAHDIVDGFGGKEIVMDLASDKGPGYSISR